MHIRNLFLFVVIFLVTLSTHAQQKVDLDKAMAENPNLYTGGYTRVGIGFSSANFSYGTVFDGLSLSPLRFHLDFGKRMSRSYGIYFSMAGDVLLKEVQSGYNLLNSWAQIGMHVGGLFYIKGGRSYIAPEAGLGIITFDYDDSYTGYNEQPYCLGLGTSLKYGYDRHISGNVSLGGQLYITYNHTWETDIPEGYEAYMGKCFIYGASFNLKFGK
ncbi:MAG: hypothetical protein ABFS28_00175 [Bacteroidota bacterium]